jgi:hypothetical protein
VSGLGVLDWLVSNIATWIVGLLNGEVVTVVNDILRNKVAEILPSIDPNVYFG